VTDKTQGGFLISQIKQISGRIFEKLLVSAGVEAFNGAQGRILYVLWQEEGVPIVALSQKTGLAKTTLTSMLDRMESANLILRVFDKADRRHIRIALTEKTRELSDDYNKVSREMNEIYYAGFSDDEIIAFEDTLLRILKNLKEKEHMISKSRYQFPTIFAPRHCFFTVHVKRTKHRISGCFVGSAIILIKRWASWPVSAVIS